MPKIINSIDEFSRYVGIVCSNNETTRELEVYIPKLMPAIPQLENERSELTNMNNINISVSYSNKIKSASTITVRAKNMDDALPKVNSKVLVSFLEGNINIGFWEKFNPSGDYEIIDSEKFGRQFYLTLGDRTIQVNRDDNIEIELPNNKYDIVFLENPKTKAKKLRLIEKSDINVEIQYLKNQIGNPTYKHNYTENGHEKQEIIPSTGLYKIIEELKNQIEELKNK